MPPRSSTESPARKRTPARPRKQPLTAASADKYQLYQWAVQSPEHDAAWFSSVYRRRRRQPALHLREDFSGTALLSATWVRRGPQHTAECYDIDPEPVRWGKAHNLAPLGPAAERVQLRLEDARSPSQRPPDIRVALNFSYFVFKKRADLVGYFRAVYDDLPPGSMFVLDTYGGPDAYHETEEPREIEQGFTYVWEQAQYWPVTGDYRTYIHFRFNDGSEMKRAFTYDWRLWSLPELEDALSDAGFTHIDTYWEGTAPNGVEGNGVFRKSKLGENCLAWVTYIICWK
jgi:hypothetical protein